MTTDAKDGKVYKLQAETEVDCDAWMQAIEDTVTAAKCSGGSASTLAAAGLGANNLVVPLLENLFWCGVAGITWYFQFFFYTMGEFKHIFVKSQDGFM